MYVLDTNVVAELRKAESGKADPKVTAWAQSLAPSSLFISAVTVLKVELGILLIERRDAVLGTVLRAWLDGYVLAAFAGRILDIDIAVAKLHVPDPKSERDAFIAVTALLYGMTIVTRNVEDFKPTGVEILNPWEWGWRSRCGSESHAGTLPR